MEKLEDSSSGMVHQTAIVSALSDGLEPLSYVHALWLEGSYASGHNDEYSDLDVWLSVDDEKLLIVFDDVERILKSIGEIDFKYVMKPSGELGHNVYHVTNSSRYLSLDINTQKKSRKIMLTKGIDETRIIFDKEGIVQECERQSEPFNHSASHQRLLDYVAYMKLSVDKNLLRHKPLEAVKYYHAILVYITKYLRLKNGLSQKSNFDFKHIYRDLDKVSVNQLEHLYFVKPSNMKKRLNEIDDWLKKI